MQPHVYKYGFTGTQRGMTTAQLLVVADLLRDAEGAEFHHGMCIGADAEASNVAHANGLLVIGHPGRDKNGGRYDGYADATLPPRPFLVRNHHIVDACNELIATPRAANEVLRSGTWATVRYARLRGRPITIINPDGRRV